MSVWRSFWETKQKGERERENVHLVELAARGNNLLDAELAELSLELAELLHQVILALVPELDSLNFSRRLERDRLSCQLSGSPIVCGPTKRKEKIWRAFRHGRRVTMNPSDPFKRSWIIIAAITVRSRRNWPSEDHRQRAVRRFCVGE